MSSSHLIMLVDDEEDLLILYRKFLKEAGYDTVTFTDPLMAFEHFKQNPHRYSVVVTDLRMPNMDGICLIQRMKELNKHVKTLLVTAYFREYLLGNQEFKHTQINGILEKPFEFNELRSKIIEMV